MWNWFSSLSSWYNWGITIPILVAIGAAIVSVSSVFLSLYSSKNLAKSVEKYKKELEKEYLIFKIKVTNLQEIYPNLYSKLMISNYLSVSESLIKSCEALDTVKAIQGEIVVHSSKKDFDAETEIGHINNFAVYLEEKALFLPTEVETQLQNHKKERMELYHLMNEIIDFDFIKGEVSLVYFKQLLATLRNKKNALFDSKENLKMYLRQELKSDDEK